MKFQVPDNTDVVVTPPLPMRDLSDNEIDAVSGGFSMWDVYINWLAANKGRVTAN